MYFVYFAINGSTVRHPDKRAVTEFETRNEFIKKCLFVKSMKGKILDKALTLRLAFLIIPSRCSLMLSLLSS